MKYQYSVTVEVNYKTVTRKLEKQNQAFILESKLKFKPGKALDFPCFFSNSTLHFPSFRFCFFTF